MTYDLAANHMDSRADQVIATHASLIVAVAEACRDGGRGSGLEPVLATLQSHGQQALAQALRAVLGGRHDETVLQGLDADQRVVVERVLQGIRNPATLPDPNACPDPAAAAPGLATMVHTAARGDHGARDVLDDMIEQMHRVGGDMAHLGRILRRLLQGERNAAALCDGTGALCHSLVLAILNELARLDQH